MFALKKVFLLVSTFTLVSANANAADYEMKIAGEVKGPYTVEAKIETNLPDDVVLAVSLSLTGLGPQEVAIGTSFVRVPVADGIASVVIDGRENAQPSGTDLPSAEYDLEVSFYPNWKENKEISFESGIEDNVEDSVTIEMEMSGASRNEVVEREEGQRWVMENVYGGTPWDYGFWVEKHGSVENVPMTGTKNAKIIKMFYVEAIEMTFMVNIPEREVITWRMGRASD